jgi:hypothetical protein
MSRTDSGLGFGRQPARFLAVPGFDDPAMAQAAEFDLASRHMLLS